MRCNWYRRFSMRRLIDDFWDIGKRFHGVDLSFRRSGVDWPKLWRAKSVSTKRPSYQKTAYGDTPEESILGLLEAIKQEDQGNQSI